MPEIQLRAELWIENNRFTGLRLIADKKDSETISRLMNGKIKGLAYGCKVPLVPSAYGDVKGGYECLLLPSGVFSSTPFPSGPQDLGIDPSKLAPAMDVPSGSIGVVQATLRDQFAMAALTGMVQRGWDIESVGRVAYKYADALIEARKR